MKIIAPSMLSSNFGRLIDEIELINKSNADWFHLRRHGWCFCS